MNKFFKIYFLAITLIFGSFTVYIFVFEKNITAAAQRGDSFGVLNSFFSAFTFVILVYTLYLQSQTLQKQREDSALSIKPLLSIKVIPDTNLQTYYLDVSNIGNGAAINVRVSPIQLNGPKPFNVKLSFGQPITALPVSGTERVEIETTLPESLKESMVHSGKHIDPQKAKESYELTVKYQDLNSNNFTQKFRVGEGGIVLTELNGLVI